MLAPGAFFYPFDLGLGYASMKLERKTNIMETKKGCTDHHACLHCAVEATLTKEAVASLTEEQLRGALHIVSAMRWWALARGAS